MSTGCSVSTRDRVTSVSSVSTLHRVNRVSAVSSLAAARRSPRRPVAPIPLAGSAASPVGHAHPSRGVPSSSRPGRRAMNLADLRNGLRPRLQIKGVGDSLLQAYCATSPHAAAHVSEVSRCRTAEGAGLWRNTIAK